MNDSTKQTIQVPDLGGAEDVEIIELCVAAGDSVDEEQSLCVLESDKASMEVPSPKAGEVVEWLCKEGDTVNEGDDLLVISAAADAGDDDAEEEQASQQADSSDYSEDESAEENSQSAQSEQTSSEQTVTVPDIGGAEEVDVIEICVAEGDSIEEGDSIVVLESDKASMEVPSPAAGKVKKMLVKEGDKVQEGSELLILLGAGGGTSSSSDDKADKSDDSGSESSAKAGGESAEKPEQKSDERASDSKQKSPSSSQKSSKSSEKRASNTGSKSSADEKTYAGPAVRKMARELGVELSQVEGSGPKNRVLKEDLQAYVKSALSSPASTGASGIPAVPAVD